MCHTLLSNSSIEEIHHQWMIKYGRTYANTYELEKRKTIFKENLEFIEKKNKKNRAEGKNDTQGLNDFSDLTAKEMTSCVGIMDIPSELVSSKTILFNMSIDDIPESVDWRDKEAVTSVRNQGDCGGCWAFATIAAVEGLWQIRTGDLVPLSVQQLIDCDFGSKGCSYGYLSSAFKYATTTRNGAIYSEKDYPFKEIQQTCRTDFTPAASFDGYQFVAHGDEQQLLQAVAQQPVTVAIDADTDDFVTYKSAEIYSGPCGSNLNHAVTIVGYGVSDDGQKYWIIKNSWGTDWADSGYIKLIRGTDTPGGHCGILSGNAIYPTLNPKPHN